MADGARWPVGDLARLGSLGATDLLDVLEAELIAEHKHQIAEWERVTRRRRRVNVVFGALCVVAALVGWWFW